MNQEKQQEIMIKFSMFEQQMRQIQEQIEAVERGINELGNLNFGLDELKGAKGKEALSPLGRGVFVKTNLAEEELVVDIGGGNFVKKNIPETKKIIEEQIKKLISVKNELHNHLENLNKEITKSMEEFQEKQED